MTRSVRRFAPIALAVSALALLGSPASAERKSGEERLAEMIEGRVAGEPQSCVNTFDSRPLTVLDGTAIVYESGGTVYVNRTRNPETLDEDDLLVIHRVSNRLCRSDIVTTRSRPGLFYSGNIMLTDFVPYKRVEEG